MAIISATTGLGVWVEWRMRQRPAQGRPDGAFVFLRRRGCAMSPLSSFRLAAIVFAMVLWGSPGLAQELDAKWLAGTWRGTTPSPIEGRVDEREIEFHGDGSFTGEIKSARGGLLPISGSYKTTS